MGVLPPAACHGVCVVHRAPTHPCAPTHPYAPTMGSYISCRASQLLSLMATEQERGSPASSSLGKHGKGCVCLVQAFPIQKPLQFKKKSNQIKSSPSTQATGMQLSLFGDSVI